jgi:hypothetical protein
MSADIRDGTELSAWMISIGVDLPLPSLSLLNTDSSSPLFHAAMASQMKEQLPHAATTPKKQLLIEEVLISLDTLIRPTPRLFGRAPR